MQRVLAAAAGAVAIGLVSWTPAAEMGHCMYTQQGQAAHHDVCEAPIDEATCTLISNTGRHSNGRFALGACPVDELVGTCDKGITKIFYFSGDPAQLEIGCGYQGGTWLHP